VACPSLSINRCSAAAGAVNAVSIDPLFGGGRRSKIDHFDDVRTGKVERDLPLCFCY
jgi:hypothetical protein